MERKGDEHSTAHTKKSRRIGFGFAIILLVVLLAIYFFLIESNDKPEQIINDQTVSNSEIVDGIHVRTGLKDGEGLMTVVANCTACHSAQLVIQNRMNKERWDATIRWMQETQNLWDLGDNQEVIVNYLVKNYPVNSKGRRSNLQDIEWYELSD